MTDAEGSATATAAATTAASSSAPGAEAVHEARLARHETAAGLSGRFSLRQIQFLLDRAVRYHQRRRSFFERCHKGTLAVSLLSMTAMFGNQLSSGWAGAIVVLVSIGDFLIGFSDLADVHRELARRYLSLRAEASAENAGEKLAKWEAELFLVEQDEPTAFLALEAHCCNQALWARDGRTIQSRPDERVLKWWHFGFMHVWPFAGTDFRTRKELDEEAAATSAPATSSAAAE